MNGRSKVLRSLRTVQVLHWQPPEGGQIIKGMDLAIPDGKLVVLTGPNVGGKTTLAKLIAGLETPTSGPVSYTHLWLCLFQTGTAENKEAYERKLVENIFEPSKYTHLFETSLHSSLKGLILIIELPSTASDTSGYFGTHSV